MQETGPGEGKAFRTRDRVVDWLAAHGDIEDAAGMASPRLGEAVGYPGSSVAFAQLLSGMERSGLITREVRGKRTYRVSLAAAGRARARALAQPGGGPGPAAGSPARAPRRPGGELARPGWAPQQEGAPAEATAAEGVAAEGVADYDELARRLLVQVAQRLLPADGDAGASRTGSSSQRQVEALQDKVAVLEHELSQARAARTALEAENDELRDQLERIRVNLDRAEAHLRPRQQPAAAESLDQNEIALLQRLLGRPASRPDDRASTA